jgi:signal transduction histidine kinase
MKQLILPYNASVMSFEYASMDFASSEKNEYQYILENFDLEWNEVGNQRKATYTNLSPGNYVFKVRGTNNDGVWSDKEINLPITILPPWWLTWWMKVIYWILGVGIPFVIYFSRVSTLKKQRTKLRQQVIKRTKEVVQQKEEIETQAEELKTTNEKLLELDEFKQGMTSMIVHDLKNPLNAIINAPKSISYEDQITSTKQSGKQMLNMVLNMLDVYKYEETKMELDKLDYSIHTLSQNAINEVAYLAERKNIEIKHNITPKLSVNADKGIIKRVFVNLLTNAIKYTPNNGEIIINGEYQEANSDKLMISVRDTGIGISQDKIHKVFDKFGQVLAKKSGSVRSTGLGLTFCKIAVEAHGGQISVESECGVGTKFWFTLQKGMSKQYLSDTETKIHEKSEINLIAADVEVIMPHIENLRKLLVNQTSKINKILNRIDTDGSDTLQKWKNEIEKCLFSMNEERYNKLIKMIIKFQK